MSYETKTQVMLYIDELPNMWVIVRYSMWVRHFIYIAGTLDTDSKEQAVVEEIGQTLPGGCVSWIKKQDHVYDFQLNNNIVFTYIFMGDIHDAADLIQPVTSLYICRYAGDEWDLEYLFDRSLMPSLTKVFGSPYSAFIREHNDLEFIYARAIMARTDG